MTVVIPCRNEASYIGACLASIVATTYPTDRLEVLVVEGGSDDGTRDVVARYAEVHPWIRALDNPQRTTPAALNIGIRAASGEVIMRMDAHFVYPPDYIPRSVAALEASGVANVGGVLVTLPADDSLFGHAIALALSHPFGVGNAYFRIGTSAPRLVDTVALGCWRRELFGQIGLFDEELVRNQDDELNARIARHGGRVLLDPGIRAHYYARRSLGEVARMFYQYGYFKPLVAKKVGRVMTVRQLVPVLFLLGIVAGLLVGIQRPVPTWLAGVIPVLYVAAIAACATRAAPRRDWLCALALAAVFPTMHFSYGVGFLRGVFDHVLRRRRRVPVSIALSRGAP